MATQHSISQVDNNFGEPSEDTESGPVQSTNLSSKEQKRIDNGSLEEDVLMPDIYANDNDPLMPDMKILGEPSSEVDESEGFNPYDTAVIVKK